MQKYSNKEGVREVPIAGGPEGVKLNIISTPPEIMEFGYHENTCSNETPAGLK